jgi:hypothetical protein
VLKARGRKVPRFCYPSLLEYNRPKSQTVKLDLAPMRHLFLFAAISSVTLGQVEPGSAHVNLYFPQFADGGSAAQQWQTSFVFLNPNAVSTASVQLYIRGNDGRPLALDLGSGLSSTLAFTIPPRGARIFRSRMASPAIATGWAYAFASIPVQATVLFTSFANGASQFQISAPATLPASQYWSPANRQLGIAVANVYADAPITVNIAAVDSEGRTVGTSNVTVSPLGHQSFTLGQAIPDLPPSFLGSVVIAPVTLANNFLAWTLNSDSGALSSLPPGGIRWPISHWDRIWLVYNKVFDAAQTFLRQAGSGVDLSAPPATTLVISPEQVVNASASSDGTVRINLALSELISDSESELAFAIAHELGHIVQYRTSRLVFSSNPEFDADEWGMILSLVAGYDPYAAAGALAKLNMAIGRAGLLSQLFDNFSGDLHGSFNNRIAAVYDTIAALCTRPEVAGFCSYYKAIVHPHLPDSTPLGVSARRK